MAELLIPSGDCRLCRIDGQSYLFVEESQSVSALSADATAAWPALERGLLCDENGPVDRAICAPHVISDLLSVGAVEPLATDDGVCRVRVSQVVDTLAARVCIGYEDEALRAQLGTYFEALVSATGACNEFISVQRRDGGIAIAPHAESVEWVVQEGAVPLLKIALTSAGLNHIEDLLVHVALLQKDERAMLLVGGPGAGKSTLATALGSNGFTLAADDLAALDSRGQAWALPFPVTLKTESWALLQTRQAEIADTRAHVRPDGKEVRYLPVDPGATARPLPVGWIVFLDRSDGAAPSIALMNAPDTISGLIKSAWSGEADLTVEEFTALAGCVDGATCIKLTYSDLAPAIATLQRLCADGKRYR